MTATAQLDLFALELELPTVELEAEAFTYRAAGMTDDVTTCEVCGKPELKGTVRLVTVDVDGNAAGETFAGSSCAAKLAGRPAKEIRTEARRADVERRAAWSAHQDRFHRFEYALVQDWLDDAGLERRLHTVTAANADPFVVHQVAAWHAASPAPERPAGW